MRVAAVTLCSFFAAVSPAAACGGPLAPTDGGTPARLMGERALVTFAQGRETIVPVLELRGDRRSRSAVLVPVPTTPRVTAAPKGLFPFLSGVTRPRVIHRPRSPLTGGGGPGAGGGAPVEVISHRRIGAADVAVVRSGDPVALGRWLGRHGFELQKGAQSAMRAYTLERWAFVAVRFTRTGSGTSAPVAISFPTPRIVYPKRFDALAGRRVPMRLYVLARHRIRAPGLETVYAGRVADLRDRPPRALRATFRRAPYLTRLETTGLAKSALRRDLLLERARTDAPFRKVVYD
jgi:hypothetical protein